MLGNGRLEALCFDGEKRLAHIRGKLRKKVWINQGDIILLSLRDYQDEKGDVILKYSADEARSLKAYGELPESAKINETDTYVSPDNAPDVVDGADWDYADMVTKVSKTMSSSTRTGIAVMRKKSTSMKSRKFPSTTSQPVFRLRTLSAKHSRRGPPPPYDHFLHEPCASMHVSQLVKLTGMGTGTIASQWIVQWEKRQRIP